MERLEYNELLKDLAKIQRLVSKMNDKYSSIDTRLVWSALDDIRVDELQKVVR